MKYIYDLLQTCIVPRYCVLSGWLPPDVLQAWQSETLHGRLCGTDAQGMLKVLSVLLTVNSGDEPYLACLSIKASSKHCNRTQSVIHVF